MSTSARGSGACVVHAQVQAASERGVWGVRRSTPLLTKNGLTVTGPRAQANVGWMVVRRKVRGEARLRKAKRAWRAEAVEESPRPLASPTAVAAEAIRTGILPAVAARSRGEIPREDETIRVGDPDDRSLVNEYVGDEVPGGDAPTPDQNSVDDIGRAYGLQEEDTGALRSGAEVLARRDRRRPELRPPHRPTL